MSPPVPCMPCTVIKDCTFIRVLRVLIYKHYLKRKEATKIRFIKQIVECRISPKLNPCKIRGKEILVEQISKPRSNIFFPLIYQAFAV